MREVRQSLKLNDVCYDIRGPVMAEAMRRESQGHEILKLNIGNPAPFGFEAPRHVREAVAQALSSAEGYSDSRGIAQTREAVVAHYQARGVPGVHADLVFLGNGVSELIVMTLQALLNAGDEVLVPAPDYPLWTAAISLAGGTPVHYLCDESQEWQPDLEDVRAKVTPQTKALVIINPNNPTGAVYSEATLQGLLRIAREHHLVVFSDEIYDAIVYDDAVHHHTASLAPDLLCLTFNGLSKTFRLAGYRAGWLVITGPTHRAQDYLEGLSVLANMRLCANVPAQHAVTAALTGPDSIAELVRADGRFAAQAQVAHSILTSVEGISCVRPRGALYVFPRLDPEVFPCFDDEQRVLDILRATDVLLVQGTGFNWPRHDHLRIVTLPSVEVLREALHRVTEYLLTTKV
ncbi:putative isovaleryl-CoA dehydrogenase/auxin binding protein [Platysternon megacephalum]|uniref:Putative isovaleryl-CoA dehydrogenase/auxin binding protein n=1 Tax=Platysternon megacephalum TaxID=55544 RepID=A0A4D9DF57_9SAUR|nr:putative isovaleryl-CoA dehydrogenase/auxin binding protein [Platysternon megacephalum]